MLLGNPAIKRPRKVLAALLSNNFGGGNRIPRAGLAAQFDARFGITSSGGFASQWNDLSGNARHLLQATGANQPIHLPIGTITSGTAAAGSTGTTLNLAASALAVNDVYNDMTVTITGGTGSGQSRTILDYVGATKIATVAAWSVTPDNTSAYAITASQSSVYFDGAAHFMKCSSFTLTQPESIYIVGKPVTWTNDDRWCDGNTLDTGTMQQVIGSPQMRLYAGGYVTGSLSPTLGSKTVLCAVINGASSVFQSPTVTLTGNAGASNMGGFTLAASGLNVNFCNLQVYEALVYNVAHGAATRANVINALKTKWEVA